MKRRNILLTLLLLPTLSAPAMAASGPEVFHFAPLVGLVAGNLLAGSILLLLAGVLLAALVERLKARFATPRRKRLVIGRGAAEPVAQRVPVAVPRSTGRRYRRGDA